MKTQIHIDKFKHDFNKLNGVYATDWVILFRNPLELYDMSTGQIIAAFKSLDEALAYENNGKTLEQRVSSWVEIVFPIDNDGSGGNSGMGFSGKWPSSEGSGGKDETTADFPARMNTNRSYNDMLKAFADTHRDADIEHGAVIDAQGFPTLKPVTKFVTG